MVLLSSREDGFGFSALCSPSEPSLNRINIIDAKQESGRAAQCFGMGAKFKKMV